MEVPKEILFHVSYFVDDPKTWLSLMLTCKNAKKVCEYRKEQKQWQFQPVYISGQYSKYGFDWDHCKISESYPQDLIDDHREAQDGGRIMIAGSVWGDGKYVVFKKTRLEVMKKLGTSLI